ncbi:SGNH/GDSL hydrolase family protein [Phycicoccus endophyticus]|uniref:SGNH/GDSL hydrolase family protein n=1 Tax=Phycicoccus endophyticus TaxID=1690220 RepID=A0A7G9R094_9MICO|nr:SGNH/GDSL hydrolase family protein [Phycicoccus endophyticus]NHI20178.1 SGNH/GDSL hydrolase family protein [Phycicoccus endophyticus]QNN49019.1 SGNH/GDSL hydrolase family protein [Phycicoccus endophyticus]GGL44654.1 hypothetical protein GCM10012283_29060 [Phycicoccus endophyticus]
MARFVALGDSLTEGVGDPHPAYPNGWRGWAELVADALAVDDPSTEYVNLALRGRRVAQVLQHQVDPAVALRPTLVTLWAGGNDLLLPRVCVDTVAGTLDAALRRLEPTGARVLLFTIFELDPSPVLRAARARASALNDRVRAVARARGAELVDVADVGHDRETFFCPDRVHPNEAGHLEIARRVAGALRLGPVLPAGPAAGAVVRRVPGWAGEWGWWFGSVVPHAWRWATAAGSRERVDPKWALPVRPAERLASAAEP